MFNPERIKPLLKTNRGRNIICMETADSTNTIAMAYADKGAVHGTVVIAESQTKGRGRLGRNWISPEGMNIYMSIILRPALKTDAATFLTILAAVSCAEAVTAASGINVRIKWPNDLMSGCKKLGGILTEIKSFSGNILFAVTGIGININTPIESLPEDVTSAATSVCREAEKSGNGSTGDCQSLRYSIVSGILNEIDKWYDIAITGGEKFLLDEWRRLTSTLGEPVSVTAGTEVFTGIADDIDEYGRLLLRLPSGDLKKISSGEISSCRTNNAHSY